MSIDDLDYGVPDDYGDSVDQYKEWLADLYYEHIDEFTQERLASYYIENPNILIDPIRLFSIAKDIVTSHPSASLIFSAAAIETGIKMDLLRPIVYGMVHSESVASMISELTISHVGIERYRSLLFKILTEHIGFKLDDYTRDGAKQSIWEEIILIQKCRNVVLHKGTIGHISEDFARVAMSVASSILEEIIPRVILGLGLHIHDDLSLCNKKPCGRTMKYF